MERKKINFKVFIPAFLLTIILFLIGFILGAYVSEYKLQQVYDLQNDLRIDSLGNELLFELISENLCEAANFTVYTKEMTSIGKKVDYLESLEGYNSNTVKALKNYYSLLLIRHWLISKRLKQECTDAKDYVLFFYTNIGECTDCEGQGFVLTNVHKKNPLFYIYSFEFYQDNPALNFLKEKYDIKSNRLPTLVINNTIYYGFKSRKFLIEILGLDA